MATCVISLTLMRFFLISAIPNQFCNDVRNAIKVLIILALVLPAVCWGSSCKDVVHEAVREEGQVKFRMGKKQVIQRLLAVVAMGVEEEAILKTLGSYDEVVISSVLGIKAKIFRKDGKELILVASGIGPVNAGLTVALVSEKYLLDGVILFGVAGAVKPGLEIGHLIVATDVVQHDSIYSGESGDELMAPGLPFVSLKPHERASPIFETDHEFREWLTFAIKSFPQLKIREGKLLSGSEFVGSAARKIEIGRNVKDAIAVEMEAAGIAVVVGRLDLPFAVLKTVADRLNPDQSISNDYNQFIKSAAENAGAVMNIVWKSWTDER